MITKLARQTPTHHTIAHGGLILWTMQSLRKTIFTVRYVYRALPLFTRTSHRSALNRLTNAGRLRRIDRGKYQMVPGFSLAEFARTVRG